MPGAGGEGDTLDTFLVLCLMRCGVLVASAFAGVLVTTLLVEEDERNPAACDRLLRSPEFVQFIDSVEEFNAVAKSDDPA